MNGSRIPTLIYGILLYFLFIPTYVLADFSAGQLNQQAIEAHQNGSAEQALILLRKAHQADPYDVQITKNLSIALLNRGRQLMKQGQHQAAAELFSEGQLLAPDNVAFWIDRAHAMMVGRDYSTAEVDLNEALGMDPEQAVAWQLLGRLYYLTSRLPEAIDAWQKALDLGGETSSLREMLAKARRELLVETNMTQNYAASFMLSYDIDSRPDLVNELLDVLNQAYIEVGVNLDYYPPGQVPVLIYTKKDFSHITASPGWAAGLYDGKIRIPLGGVNEVTAPLRAIMFHEYVHVVVRDLAGGRCPTWLNEGLAEQVGRGQFDPPLQILNKAESLLGFDRLSRSWKDLPAEKVRLAYEQSYSFVHFLIDDYGWYSIGDVLRNLARGEDVNAAFSIAFASYGLDLNALQLQWRQRVGRS